MSHNSVFFFCSIASYIQLKGTHRFQPYSDQYNNIVLPYDHWGFPMLSNECFSLSNVVSSLMSHHSPLGALRKAVICTTDSVDLNLHRKFSMSLYMNRMEITEIGQLASLQAGSCGEPFRWTRNGRQLELYWLGENFASFSDSNVLFSTTRVGQSANASDASNGITGAWIRQTMCRSSGASRLKAGKLAVRMRWYQRDSYYVNHRISMIIGSNWSELSGCLLRTNQFSWTPWRIRFKGNFVTAEQKRFSFLINRQRISLWLAFGIKARGLADWQLFCQKIPEDSKWQSRLIDRPIDRLATNRLRVGVFDVSNVL